MAVHQDEVEGALRDPEGLNTEPRTLRQPVVLPVKYRAAAEKESYTYTIELNLVPGSWTAGIALTDELAGVTDPDGDPVRVERVVSTPTHGRLAVNTLMGRFSYTPDADFHGTDSFTVAVTDGQETVDRTVTITVRPVKTSPP